ncbi:MAG: XdhC family protein [Thiohalospira sp.]
MKVWNFIRKELSESKNVTLIIVVERNGSSPGIVGFKMAVSETGAMSGSIGGGVMEYNMVDLAKKFAQNNHQKPFIKKQIHQPDADENKSGLICSGEQTHAFIPLNSSHIKQIDKIIATLEKGNNGALNLNNNGLSFDENQKYDEPVQYIFNNENDWIYREQIGLKDTIYIFGAGHISIPLSQVCRMLDFKVIVLDDRKDLSTFNNNQYAHQKKIIDFNHIEDIVSENNQSYAVIMTVAHKNDEVVLKQLVIKKLKYLGMIGSKNKVKTIYDSLIKEGISEKDLAKVDAPIGLSINSKTTAEIAISIAAKIIQVRNS